jgi:type IV pilus assembly protein PilY1
MNTRTLRFLFAMWLLAAVRPAIADDTDLFVRPSGASSPPDVLFVIDNAANFSANSTESCIIGGSPTALSGKVGGIEQCALYETIAALDPGSVNIGIMVYNANNVQNNLGVACVAIVSSKPGGCLVYEMQLMTAPNKTTLLNWIRSWKVSGSGLGYIKANSEATGGSLQEAWAYYNGRTGLSGRNYASSVPPTTCNKYIIFIGNSFNNSGSPGDYSGNTGPKTAIDGANSTAGMNAYPPATAVERTIMNRTITTEQCGTATLGNPHDTKGYYMDEWARYLNAHAIKTFTIGVIGDGCQADYVALLMNTAEVGGGQYFETKNTQELKDALGAALSAMIATNSVFASVSLPVSVNTQGFFLNQVYIGMFRPDANALPRWFGNLKQYKLGRPSGQSTGLELQDANGDSAISSAGSGFIDTCARSFWTPTVGDSYWEPYVGHVPPFCSGYLPESNTPDGNIVEKGGQGYLLRGSPTAPSISRNLKTCNGTCSSTLANFDTSNAAVTKTALGDALMTDPDRTDLINWEVGVHNKYEQSNVLSTAMRPSVHGDVVHSKPVALNFGSDTTPQIVVFYGGNDGVLRAVNGNRTTAIGSAAAGAELWSFVAPEFYPQIERLRSNSVPIIPTDANPTSLPKPYGFDGPLVADTVAGVGGHTWLFATMRRGGRMVYAFDVSTINSSPTSPTLKWRIGCPNLANDTGCITGWSGIGQTWSAPKVIRVTGGTSPLLVMGGGYDVCEDADPATCGISSKGSRIYVIDADFGTKVQEIDLSADNGYRGVVADVFVVPDANGNAMWIYAVDLGGNLWRISGADANSPLDAAALGNWHATRIASLGCADASGTSCSHQRKFMYAPDVVEKNGVYYLLFGSGDREKPLDGYTNAYNTTNYFFMVQDVPTRSDWLAGLNCNNHDLICMSSLVDATTATADALGNAKGWYLPLTNVNSQGTHEQVVTSAITVFGNVTFSTAAPPVATSEDACDWKNHAWVYNVRLFNAAPAPGNVNRSAEIEGGGLPPSPVAGMVKLDDGTLVPFLIGGSSDSPLEGGQPVGPSSSTLPKSLTYWFIHK